MKTKEQMLKNIYKVIKPSWNIFTIEYLWWWNTSLIDVIMIWDVLDWIQKNKMEWLRRPHLEEERLEFYELFHDVCWKWQDKRKPIGEQSFECIKFVDWLLSAQQYYLLFITDGTIK